MSNAHGKVAILNHKVYWYSERTIREVSHVKNNSSSDNIVSIAMVMPPTASNGSFIYIALEPYNCLTESALPYSLCRAATNTISNAK